MADKALEISSASLPSPPDIAVEEIVLPLILRQFAYSDIKHDLQCCMIRAGRLCLLQSQKWAAEMLKPMEKIKSKGAPELDVSESQVCSSHPAYFAIHNAMLRYQYGEATMYAKMYQEEFAKFPVLRFFYYFNKYLHGQVQWIQNCSHPLEFESIAESDMHYLQNLRSEMKEELLHNTLDPLLRYLYAVILRQLGSPALACDQLVLAIAVEPRLWCFWYELSDCILTRTELDAVIPRLKVHWMRDLFLGRTYYLLNMTEEAYGTYKYLRKTLFSNTGYVLAELAKVCYNRKELVDSVKLMEKLRGLEPARLDDMDFYSNVLYGRGDKTRLAKLARDLHDIDRFAPETNIAIANYYGLRDQHDRAIEHLTLALRACPDLPHAWLFLGHEYLELKNIPRAIASFEKAVEANPRDYRAWFGLGKVHETEKKYALAVLYYQRSATSAYHEAKPWCGLGDVFVKINQPDDAARAYWQAYQNGDKEDGAIGKLGKIYSKTDPTKAVKAYERYIDNCEEMGIKGKDDMNRNPFAADLGEAYLFLAKQQADAGNKSDAREWGRKAVGVSGTAKAASEFLESLDGSTAEKGSDGLDSSVAEGAGTEALISDDEENLPSSAT